MAYRQDWVHYIRRRAVQLGLDPEAVLAVAASEGLSGGVGDKGTSFGPFQLHVGGALPRGRDRGWAESPEGIDYALRQILGVSKGLKGRAAIAAIVSQFERPADPKGEIARASGLYGSFGAGSSSGRTLGPDPRSGGSTPSPAATLPSLPNPFDPMTSLQRLAAGTYDPTQALSEAFQVKKQQQAMLKQFGPEPFSDASPPHEGPEEPVTPKMKGGSWKKWVALGPGMDRAGHATRPEVFQHVARIAQVFGQKLTIGTGSNHREFVAGSDRRSDHWFGQAADIPMAGAALTRLGQAALIAAGADPKWAAQQKGGVFNINGQNILFNTNVGGNHYNHLHVGFGRILGRPQ